MKSSKFSKGERQKQKPKTHVFGKNKCKKHVFSCVIYTISLMVDSRIKKESQEILLMTIFKDMKTRFYCSIRTTFSYFQFFLWLNLALMILSSDPTHPIRVTTKQTKLRTLKAIHVLVQALIFLCLKNISRGK